MVYLTSGTLSVQERRAAKIRLTEEFAKILVMNPEKKACWKGTKTDLVEVAHIAYECGTICNNNGELMTFTELVVRACQSLHVEVPRNPRRTAYQARNRKGTRQRTFMERYCMMLYERHIEQPLLENVL